MSETERLASWLIAARDDEIPEDVRHEARRALVDYVGCAMAGSTHVAVEIVLRALRPVSGAGTSQVLGRAERVDPLLASLANGISAHVHDYDDITPNNYVHASSAVASALLAYASANRVTGEDFVRAFVLGFEVESRIGGAVFPAHYDAGWHITSTAGVFGAVSAIGTLVGLSNVQMVWAIGLAATQSAGLREMFGSMAKAFHPGRSAQNGYTAALLAREGFTAGERSLEGPRGFLAVLAGKYDLSKITSGLGGEWALRGNTYKPFPCVHVSHPTIDAAIQLHDDMQLAPAQIARVHVRVARSALELCGHTDVTTASQSKFSIIHCTAVGLVRGRAGLREFSAAAVDDPLLRYVRARIEAAPDDEMKDDQALVEVELIDGRTLTRRVDGSLGTLKNPMTDRQLEQKFREQGMCVLPAAQVEDVLTMCWKIDALDDAGSLVTLTAPVLATSSYATPC